MAKPHEKLLKNTTEDKETPQDPIITPTEPKNDQSREQQYFEAKRRIVFKIPIVNKLLQKTKK